MLIHAPGMKWWACVRTCVLRGKFSRFTVLNYTSSAKGRLEEGGIAFLKEETHCVNCFVTEMSHWGSCTTSRVQGIILMHIKPAFDLWNSKYLQVQKAFARSLFVFIISFVRATALRRRLLEGWSSHRFISRWNSVCLIWCVIICSMKVWAVMLTEIPRSC